MKLINQLALFVLFTFGFIGTSHSKPLTPEDFIKKSYFRSVKVSPDGEHIAASIVTSKESTIMFFKRSNMKAVGRLAFSSNTEPGNFHWANNERIVFQLLELEPWLEVPGYYGQFLAVNIDGTKAETIYGYANTEETLSGGRARKRKIATRGHAYVLDLIPEDDKNIIVESIPYKNDGSGHPSILKLNIYSGKITSRLGTSPVERGGFLSDGNGNIRLAYGFNEDNELKVYRRINNNSSWKLVNDKNYTRNFTPLTFINGTDEIYVGDEINEGYISLFKMNLNTGEYSKALINQTIDVSSFSIDQNTHHLVRANIDNGYPESIVLNPKQEESQLYTKLLKIFTNRNIEITSRSNNNNFVIVHSSSDVEPGNYYLYEKQTNKLKKLFGSMSKIKPKQLAQMTPISYAARDGTLINGYLTLPKNKAKKHPAVVMVHGGPHGVRNYWEYNTEVQILASQGFAVLQINYRGSKGYGHKFESSGYKHWGDLIQQDIIDGSLWLAHQPDIDETKLCIMGGSFGAYSAVMSATLKPKLFKCVVANAGVYDLPLMHEKGDIQDSFDGKHYLNEVLGSDMQQLSAFSPVNRVQHLEAALLIAHGIKDERAPVEHAYRLRDAMKKQGKPFEWFTEDKEGHGFYSEKSRLDYWNKVISFLDSHIGEK